MTGLVDGAMPRMLAANGISAMTVSLIATFSLLNAADAAKEPCGGTPPQNAEYAFSRVLDSSWKDNLGDDGILGVVFDSEIYKNSADYFVDVRIVSVSGSTIPFVIRPLCKDRIIKTKKTTLLPTSVTGLSRTADNSIEIDLAMPTDEKWRDLPADELELRLAGKNFDKLVNVQGFDPQNGQ